MNLRNKNINEIYLQRYLLDTIIERGFFIHKGKIFYFRKEDLVAIEKYKSLTYTKNGETYIIKIK